MKLIRVTDTKAKAWYLNAVYILRLTECGVGDHPRQTEISLSSFNMNLRVKGPLIEIAKQVEEALSDGFRTSFLPK